MHAYTCKHTTTIIVIEIFFELIHITIAIFLYTMLIYQIVYKISVVTINVKNINEH